MSRRLILLLTVAVALFTLAPAVGAGGLEFGAQLSGANEVPPVDTDGTGEVNFEFNGRSVDFELSWSGLTSTAVAAHIHCGAAGQNGPVGVTLFMGAMGTEGEVQNTFISPDAGNSCGWKSRGEVVGAVASGGAYVNVHTAMHPSGEIRGQLSLNRRGG